MKFRMSRQLQKSEARIASQADRGVDRQAAEPARRRFATLSGAASDAKQEALWAKLIAERPDTLSEIATFIQGARRRIAGGGRGAPERDPTTPEISPVRAHAVHRPLGWDGRADRARTPP
jgi:hypothetical protein